MGSESNDGRGLPASCVALTAVAVLSSGAATRALAQDGLTGFGSMLFRTEWNEPSFAAVAAGGRHTAAVRADGSFVVWGSNLDGEGLVPEPGPGLQYIQVAVGGRHVAALRSDGTIA